jgi:hypothetical protein
MLIPKTVAEKLISKYGGTKHKLPNFGEYWMVKNSPIYLTENRMSVDALEAIAIEVLQIGQWEFDYFLGQNGIA